MPRRLPSRSASTWAERPLRRIENPADKLRTATSGANAGGGKRPPLVLTSLRNGVLTVTMNDPKRLNAWSVVVLQNTT